MNPHRSLDSAITYLDVQVASPRRSAMGVHFATEGPFVTLSREAGAGGVLLANALAEKLNSNQGPDAVPWTVFEKNLVERMLSDRRLSPRLAQFLPEAGISEFSASIREIVGLHPNLWTLIRESTALMIELARRGHAILVGRGGCFATARIGNGVHVRLVAPVEHRAERVAEKLGIAISQARARNKRADADRRHYIRSVFDSDVADPLAYDLLINTARLDTSRAVTLIASLIHEPVEAAR